MSPQLYHNLHMAIKYKNQSLYLCFIHFTKAFDSIDWNTLWNIIQAVWDTTESGQFSQMPV